MRSFWKPVTCSKLWIFPILILVFVCFILVDVPTPIFRHEIQGIGNRTSIRTVAFHAKELHKQNQHNQRLLRKNRDKHNYRALTSKYLTADPWVLHFSESHKNMRKYEFSFSERESNGAPPTAAKPTRSSFAGNDGSRKQLHSNNLYTSYHGNTTHTAKQQDENPHSAHSSMKSENLYAHYRNFLQAVSRIHDKTSFNKKRKKKVQI